MSKELEAILKSTVANAQLTTGREVERSYNDKKNGTFYRKPVRAELRQDVEPTGSNTKEDVFKEVVGLTQSSGWKRVDSGSQSGHYSALLSGGSFSLMVEIFNHSDSSSIGIRVTHVARLDQGN
jgi:hypothetical protein